MADNRDNLLHGGGSTAAFSVSETAVESHTDKAFMSNYIIFDIRSLQKCALDYTPLDRTLICLINNIPTSVLEWGTVKLIADNIRDLPPSLEKWRDHVVCAPPYRGETVLVIQPRGSDRAFLDLMPLRLRAATHVLVLNDRIAINDKAVLRDRDDEQLLMVELCLASNERAAVGEFPLNVPVAIGHEFQGALDPLESAEAEVLLDSSVPVIAVDGALAANRDIMRALLGLTRHSGARVLVLGDDTSVQSPEVSVLRASPALLGEIVRRSVATLLPAMGGARTISLSEAAQLGARCVSVDARLDVHSLDELEALPVRSTVPPAIPDYTPFWATILSLLPQPTASPVPERPCIALVTPIFPQAGGPPHSSLDLALALAKIADVEIWTDGDMLPAHRARVNAVSRLDARFDPAKYDLVVYVLGNHPMYGKIFDLMRQHGGALILHDAHMIDFLNHKFGEKRLRSILSDEYGKSIQLVEPDRVIDNLATYGRPFLREIVRHANPTIVHSPTSATYLRSLYGIEAHYFPVAMPYSFDRTELTPEARLQSKLSLRIAPTRPCIASFGEVHLSKGAKQCLFVMKELADWGIDFQFMFVGPVDPSLRDELGRRIEDYRLQDHVMIKGAVSEADYIQHLKAADIVLQIRQIPFGQVSGALLDAVSAGMHGVASENLALSIEAPEMIRRVNDRASPTIYAEQIAQLIETKAYENRPGAGWEDFVEKHSFTRYARNLLSLLLTSKN